MGRLQHRLHAVLIAWITGVLIGALALYSTGVITPLHAQNMLRYGETVEGAITADSYRALYTFEGKANDVINITLTAVQDTLDPLLVLIGADNRLLGRADDDSSNDPAAANAARLQEIRLPADSVYFIVVTRFGQDRGSTTGTYKLTLERVGLLDDAGQNSVLQFGQSVVETIDNSTPQREFAFSALRGQVITIRMRRITGDLDSSLVLTDASGTVLLTNDEAVDSPGSADAGIERYRVNESGNFVIIATRYGGSAGTSGGAFSLSLDRLDSAQIGTSADLPILLDYNVPVSGTLTADAFTRYYQLAVQANTALTIEIRRTKGSLDPVVQIVGNDGSKVLAEADRGARGVFARISSYPVYINGVVLIAVSRFNGADGVTQGDYTLVAGVTVR